jgi:hypothetical protein
VVGQSKSRNPPQESVGQAISYTRNQWEDLQTYIRDDVLNIDNNVLEGSVRVQAIGRKLTYLLGVIVPAGRWQLCIAWKEFVSDNTSIRSPILRIRWNGC